MCVLQEKKEGFVTKYEFMQKVENKNTKDLCNQMGK